MEVAEHGNEGVARDRPEDDDVEFVGVLFCERNKIMIGREEKEGIAKHG